MAAPMMNPRNYTTTVARTRKRRPISDEHWFGPLLATGFFLAIWIWQGLGEWVAALIAR